MKYLLISLIFTILANASSKKDLIIAMTSQIKEDAKSIHLYQKSKKDEIIKKFEALKLDKKPSKLKK